MEEILASIRRIIADDQEVLRGASRERGEPSPSLTNVLDLTERQSALLGRQDADPFNGLNAPEPESHDARGFDADDHSDNDLQLDTYDDVDEDANATVPRSRIQRLAIPIPAAPTRSSRAPPTHPYRTHSPGSARPSCRPSRRRSKTS